MSEPESEHALLATLLALTTDMEAAAKLCDWSTVSTLDLQRRRLLTHDAASEVADRCLQEADQLLIDLSRHCELRENIRAADKRLRAVAIKHRDDVAEAVTAQRARQLAKGRYLHTQSASRPS